MKTKLQNWNVPFSFKLLKVYQKVDKKLLLSLVFLIGFSIMSTAQNQKRVDSLLIIIETQKDTTKINTYTQLFIEYIHVDPKIAKQYLDAEMDLAKSINNKMYIARTNINYGTFLSNSSKFDEAILVFDKLIKDFEALNSPYYKSVALINKGNCLRDLGNYKEALEAHLQSLKITEETSDNKENIAISYWNIGNLQGDIGNIEESTAYYKKSKKLFKELNSESDTIILNLNIAQNLNDTSREAEAIPLYKDAIGFFKKVNATRDLGKIYEYLGICYMTLDSLDTSLGYFNKSLQIAKKNEETISEVSSLRRIGQVYIKQNSPIKAIPFIKESLNKSKEINAQNEIAENHLALSEASSLMGNHKFAYQNHLEYSRIHEEMLNAENIEKMNELEIKYQSTKKEKELLIKDNEIALLDARKQKAESQRLFLFITLLGLIAFAVSIVYGLRQKMKRNKVSREKLDASLAFKEKELTTHALHLAHKNEILLDLKSQLKDLKSEGNNSRNYQKVINTINLDINNDNNWEQFKNYFEDVHKDFNAKVMQNYPEVSSNDLRLMSLLKMNLSSKEIANILNISTEGVKKARYRLRKKLNLTTEDSLQELVINL